jgi:hypothetical protein
VHYLRQHIGEARGMLLSGFNEEIYEKGLREEGREEGIEFLVKNLLENNTPEFVAKQCKLDLDTVLSIKRKMS